jgi:tetrahydromethanopterin S-methyltransferase subunit C
VETERTKLLGMDPMVAMIVGAVLFIIVIMAIVSMSKRSSSTSVETTRRTSV